MIEEKKAFDSRTMAGLVTRLMEGRRRKKGKVESIGGSDHKDDSLFDIVVFGHCRPLDRAESKWQTVTRFRARPVRGLRIISLWWLAPLISRPNNRDRFMQIPTIASPPPPLSLSPRVEPSPLSPPRISFATIPEKNPLVPPIRPANAPVSLEATSYFELSMTLSFRRQMIATNSFLPSLSPHRDLSERIAREKISTRTCVLLLVEFAEGIRWRRPKTLPLLSRSNRKEEKV